MSRRFWFISKLNNSIRFFPLMLLWRFPILFCQVALYFLGFCAEILLLFDLVFIFLGCLDVMFLILLLFTMSLLMLVFVMFVNFFRTVLKNFWRRIMLTTFWNGVTRAFVFLSFILYFGLWEDMVLDLIVLSFSVSCFLEIDAFLSSVHVFFSKSVVYWVNLVVKVWRRNPFYQVALVVHNI